MKIGCLISAREKSRRFKKKLLRKLGKDTVIEYLIKRLKFLKNNDKLILSTSINKKDLVLVNYAIKHNINFFCGSEDDKLLRYYHTALAYKLDGLIIVDADDPLCFLDVIDKISQTLKTNKYDFVSTLKLPIGASATGLKVSALQKVINIKDEEDTEVWGGYFTSMKNFKKKFLRFNDYQFENLRLTLDYREDFLLIKKIISLLKTKYNYKTRELINIFAKNNELINLNETAKEKYINHLKKSAKVKFK